MVLNRIYERDIDLLIIEEFKCSRKFAALFLEKTGFGSDYIQCTAYHSQFSRFGESDITFILKYKNGKKAGILIEDKINAPSMELQSIRYTMRADELLKEKKFDDYAVFLTAPSKYIAEHKSDPNSSYKLTVSYEEICEYFKSLGDKRSLYKRDMFLNAINKKEKKTYHIDSQVSEFWNELRDYVCINFPEIVMSGKSKTHGSCSCWPEFRTDIPETKIVYKSDRGFIDFQINNYGERIIELRTNLFPLMEKDMQILKTNNSASIRLSNPDWIIDFHSEFSDNLETINDVLNSVNRLIAFSKKVKDVLL